MAKKTYGEPKAGKDNRPADQQQNDPVVVEDPADGHPADTQEPAAASPETPAKDDQPAAPEKPLSPRERIAARFAEERKARMDEDAEARQSAPPAADEGDAEEKAAEPEEHQPKDDEPEPIGDDRLVKLTVDGREVDVPFSELRAIAQMDMSIANRRRALDDLNRQVREHPARQETPPAQDDTQSRRQGDQPSRDARRADLPVDADRLREIAEDLQGGDTEDAVKALGELVNSVVESTRSNVDVGQEVETRLALREQTQGLMRDVEEWGSTYDRIATDDDLSRMALGRAFSAMEEDLRKAGVDEGRIQAVVSQGPDQLAIWHDKFLQYRDPQTGQRGYPTIRPRSKILNDIGTELYAKFGFELPAQRAPNGAAANGNAGQRDRAAEKAQLTPQPRSASSMRAGAPTPPSVTRMSKPDIVKQMALSRGQRRPVPS